MSTLPSVIQVHLLTSYPAVLLNRDDAGLAKRIPFGGSTRTRISSQCLKKHWREAPALQRLGTTAVRSRLLFERFVAEPLVAKHGRSRGEAETIASFLMTEMLAGKQEEGKDEDGGTNEEAADNNDETRRIQAKQVLVFSEPEARWLTATAMEIINLAQEASVELDSPKALKKLVGKKENKEFWKQRSEILGALPASIDVALFGRFVTSDLMSRVDSAISVAHAFTTHVELAETDYFTAVDMLDESSSGAGHLNDTELTSGVFYTYVVIDVEQLRRNLGPEADQVALLAARLVRTVATTGPKAKYGSTAPYAFAEFVLIEAGGGAPRSLANAFRSAISLSGSGDVLQRSARALLDHQMALAAMYDTKTNSWLSTIHDVDTDPSIVRTKLNDAIGAAVGIDPSMVVG